MKELKQGARRVKQVSDEITQANLAAIGPDMSKMLTYVPDTPVPVEGAINVKGLKNPVYLVIIGFSTRQVLDSLRKEGKEIYNTLIIEPDLGIFKQTIQREYVGDIINDPTVDILTGIPVHELSWHIYKVFSAANMQGHRAARSINPEIFVDPFCYYDETGKPNASANQITQIIYDASKSVQLSLGCASDTFFRWEQTWRNIENIKKSFQIKSLFKKFKDFPAIVVGGGNSVEDFIKACHQYGVHKKALIISCDATLPRLLKEGIRPHLVTRCERKVTYIFDGITKEKTKDIFYCAYPWTPPEFFELFEDSIMCFRDNGICTWTGFEPGGVNGGVSAANAAVEIAYLLGVKEIYTTGIDLVYVDGKSHVEGTQIEFDPESSKEKWFDIETNDGGKATTIPVWYRCLQEYNHAVAKHANKLIPFFNTSTKGARIEGTQLMSWDQVDKRLTKEVDALSAIRANLTKHTPEYTKRFEDRKTKTIAMFKNFKKELGKLFLFLDDYMLTAQREEEKCVSQLKAYTDPREFFHQSHNIQKSLLGVYKKGMDHVNKFKDTWFKDVMLGLTVIDVCMSDFFQSENKSMSLNNVMPIEYERSKVYIALNTAMFRLYETYATRLLNLMETGAVIPDFKETTLLEPKPMDTTKESALILPPQYKKKGKDDNRRAFTQP